jgi:hypothetical protein
VAAAIPARVIVAPAPPLIVPEILKGWVTTAVKLMPVATLPLMVTVWLAGVKVTPGLLAEIV